MNTSTAITSRLSLTPFMEVAFSPRSDAERQWERYRSLRGNVALGIKKDIDNPEANVFFADPLRAVRNWIGEQQLRTDAGTLDTFAIYDIDQIGRRLQALYLSDSLSIEEKELLSTGLYEAFTHYGRALFRDVQGKDPSPELFAGSRWLKELSSCFSAQLEAREKTYSTIEYYNQRNVGTYWGNEINAIRSSARNLRASGIDPIAQW